MDCERDGGAQRVREDAAPAPRLAHRAAGRDHARDRPVQLAGQPGLRPWGSPDFDRATQDSWNTLIGGTASGITLAAPLLLAAIASRQVDIEHQGNGWLMSATSGITPGGLCRAKFLALGLLVAGATVVTSGLLAGAGLLLGITAPFPAGRWIGFTAALLAVNLVLIALHTLIAARVENQLVGIGIGLLGTILTLFGTAVPAWISHLTPLGLLRPGHCIRLRRRRSRRGHARLSEHRRALCHCGRRVPAPHPPV